MTCSISRFGLGQRRIEPEPCREDTDLVELGVTVATASSSASPTTATTGMPASAAELGHPADDLAVEAGRVEATLARHDQVDAVGVVGIEEVEDPEFVGDEFEARGSAAAQRCQRAAEATGRAAALDRRHVEVEVFVEHLHETVEAVDRAA